MSTVHALPGAASGPDTGLPASLVWLLAAGAGFAVASLYYSQPMLGVLAADLWASEGTAGFIPTLTQLGYAAGIRFLTPLGDRYDRRRIILIKSVLLALVLFASSAVSGMPAMLTSSFLIGLAATMAQDIVPAAATLAPPAHRGKVVGTVMTGLLLGILLSRVVGGLVAEQFGWRMVFTGAAVSIAGVALLAWRGLPRFHADTGMSYLALLASLVALWRRHEALRRAAWAQGLLAVAFSAFWTTLAVMLHSRYQLGSAVAGAFGAAGAAGALAAPLAGKLADRRGASLVTRLGAGLAALSFAAMALESSLSPHAQLWLIAAGAVGFDFGVQATLVAHQTIVYGLDPAARSRLNALLFTGMFVGMATGGALGSVLLAHFGWMGVVGLAVTASLAGLAVRLRTS